MVVSSQSRVYSAYDVCPTKTWTSSSELCDAGEQLVLQGVGRDDRRLDLGPASQLEALDHVAERERVPATLAQGDGEAEVGEDVEVVGDLGEGRAGALDRAPARSASSSEASTT